jgi:hypothetical protein
MFYRVNLPGWERAMRLVAGGAMAAAAWHFRDDMLLAGLLAGGGTIAALTAAFGFCPACAMVGRRPLS